jgi:hypothetical protein
LGRKLGREALLVGAFEGGLRGKLEREAVRDFEGGSWEGFEG